MKTRKSISKRFKITKNKKILRRHTRQDHFNARDSGDKTRQKRGMSRVGGARRREVMRALGLFIILFIYSFILINQ